MQDVLYKMIKNFLLGIFLINCVAAHAQKVRHFEDGRHVLYRKNKTIKEKVSVQDGKRHGVCYKYYPDGVTIKKITYYLQGKKAGLEKFYDKLGILKNFKEHKIPFDKKQFPQETSI
jgi:antitoxin component YwqK of YwqJK toxin-antitoxin module